ncbi:MAG: xanthine dehydrogenase family protein subunit M [Candidatus Melainabacteria bacterium]|nr:xanthine dehydrogenase family protein subunit M [Candidatus Melainabacteria bacterium]
MKLFSYSKQLDQKSAISEAQSASTAQQGANIRYIAGGTTLIDLMKLNVESPEKLVDITDLKLDRIETLSDDSVKVGALVKNSDLATHPYIKEQFQVLSEAILQGASAQLRNKASTAGNILQRTRCVYFRDTAFRCNKREPGSGCDAIEGDHRNLAILGTSEQCVANNPSDQNVALMALEAKIHVSGAGGERVIPIGEFYTLPGNTPHIENVLQPGDLITHVVFKNPPPGAKSTYLKLRDRASYEFALASCAVIINIDGNNISRARIALGGIGAIPWRAESIERAITGKPADEKIFADAAFEFLKQAKPLKHNEFKVELAKRCIVHALKTASQGV